MNTNVTLKTIFASSKDKMSAKLSGLSLPKDSQQVQEIVTDFLNDMFENEGQFRQNLTESEDYLLQASLRLLQTHQNIALEFAKASKNALSPMGLVNLCRHPKMEKHLQYTCQQPAPVLVHWQEEL